MAMARTLVAGSDVWLNNPLRPYEACGTSGMKAALNGCLNLSIRDGWWDELYDGRNGWAIPSADDPTIEPERRDQLEAASIYDLLGKVLPLFYDRPDGLPRGWIGMIKHNLVSLGPAILASRMVRDYTEGYYLPAAARPGGWPPRTSSPPGSWPTGSGGPRPPGRGCRCAGSRTASRRLLGAKDHCARLRRARRPRPQRGRGPGRLRPRRRRRRAAQL